MPTQIRPAAPNDEEATAVVADDEPTALPGWRGRPLRTTPTTPRRSTTWTARRSGCGYLSRRAPLSLSSWA
jgi:hypothetical protein